MVHNVLEWINGMYDHKSFAVYSVQQNTYLQINIIYKLIMSWMYLTVICIIAGIFLHSYF